MQANLTHHSTTRKSLEIRVPAPEVDALLGEVITKLAPKVRIPGFRPGKAPRTVLMQRYRQEIYREVAEGLVERHFWNAATQAGTQPISSPALEKVELGEGKEGLFKAHFDVAPEVKMPDYKALAATKQKRAIDEETVVEHLEGLRQRAARFVPEEGAAALASYTTCDIKVKAQGQKLQSHQDQVIQLTPGRPFDDQVLGMKVDETKDFEITIPAEHPDKFLAGKKVHYTVLLKDLRRREVPELSDEFAKDLGDFDNLDALKAHVRKELEEASERDGMARLQTTLLDQLLDAAPFEVPASMVNLQLDDYCQEFARQMSGQGIDPKRINWAAYRQHRMRDAERAVRSGYLLQAIGNAEEIDVTDEEIDADIRAYMEENNVQTPFAPYKAHLEQQNATTEIKGRIRTDKIFERLLTTAQITEELLDKTAFAELVELERKRETGEASVRYNPIAIMAMSTSTAPIATTSRWLRLRWRNRKRKRLKRLSNLLPFSPKRRRRAPFCYAGTLERPSWNRPTIPPSSSSRPRAASAATTSTRACSRTTSSSWARPSTTTWPTPSSPRCSSWNPRTPTRTSRSTSTAPVAL